MAVNRETCSLGNMLRYSGICWPDKSAVNSGVSHKNTAAERNEADVVRITGPHTDQNDIHSSPTPRVPSP